MKIRNHPNSTRFLAVSGSKGVQLPVEFPTEFRGFDSFGDLLDGYKIQVAEHDFDGDRNPELVFAVGDGLTNLSVCVIKYVPTASSKNPVEMRNWKVLGKFTGQQKATLTSSGIILPYGSRGLFREHKLERGKFVEKK